MATSDTEIANFAIAHLGISKPIGNLTTESSAEANACRQFYESARDESLRSFNWPFARRYVDLALIESDPTDEWAYSYRYPSDCMMIRKIFNGIRNPTQKQVEKYWLGSDSTGRLIYVDYQNASLEYTVRITDVLQFHQDFVMALSYLIAFYVAPLITRGDPYKLSERMFQFYRVSMSRAMANEYKEQQKDEFPDPSLIEARS